jgi:hypothetical protein
MTDLLINTRDNPGEFDALISLREGEQYFALVGRDRLAPPLIIKWAEQNRARALADFNRSAIDEEERERELRKSAQAEEIAWSMVEWKDGHAQAAETHEKPAYSGYVASEEQAAKDRLLRQQADARGALNNAVGEVGELIAMMPVPGTPPFLYELVKAMQSASEYLTPKRAGIA